MILSKSLISNTHLIQVHLFLFVSVNILNKYFYGHQLLLDYLLPRSAILCLISGFRTPDRTFVTFVYGQSLFTTNLDVIVTTFSQLIALSSCYNIWLTGEPWLRPDVQLYEDIIFDFHC